MSFHPHPHPNPFPQSQGPISLTPIPETFSAFVAPPPMPISTSPLRQLRAPPIPFVPQSSANMSSSLDGIPMGLFYPPDHAPAFFSTRYNNRPKRLLVAPFPAPVIRSNLEGDIEARATQLIEEFFPASQRITTEPPNLWHLHEYFDGYDLWVEGAEFCFQVMIAICNQNKILRAQLDEIDEFAKSWIKLHKTAVDHNPIFNPMTDLFNDEERMNEINDMSENQMLFLNNRLDYYRQEQLQANATPQGQQMVDPRYQTFSPHGHPIFPAVPSLPVNQIGRVPIAAPILPQVHRVRHDPGFAMAHRLVNDQYLMARGSSQGEDPSSFSLQFTELMFLGRQNQGFGSVIDTRRQITPTGHQHQASSRAFNNEHGMMRPRGISNSSQYGRGRDFSQNSMQSLGQRHVSETTRGSPSRIIPSREAVYIRNVSPQYHNAVSIGNRAVSAPTPSVPYHPANRIASSGHPQMMSPTNRAQISHDPRAMFTSPTDRGVSTNSRQYVPGSTFGQGLALLSNSPSRMTQSNDARLSIAPQKTNPRVHKHENTNTPTWTIYYRDGVRDFAGVRTCMVTGIDDSIVFNHQLRSMMEGCGTVISVHYLHSNARAFVLFSDSSAVERAIVAFNQKSLPSGHKLLVSPAYPFRSRSGSNASQNYGNSTHNSAGDFESRSRRLSIRKSSNDYSKNSHSRHSSIQNSTNPSGPFTGQLQSSLAEVVQHQSALGRQIPLSSVENVHNASKQRVPSPTKSQQDIPPTGNNAKNENVSPTKRARTYNNGENLSPRKSTGGGKKLYKTYKGSRQNTSTRPTPAVTPVKSMSAADLQDIGSLQITTDLSKMSNNKGGQPHQSPVKKNVSKSKGIQGSSKSDASQVTDAASDTTLSPVESAPMTRDTSFSAGSSRKHSQVESSQLARSQSSLEMSSMGQGAVPSKKKSKKSGKNRGHKQDPATKSEQADIRDEGLIAALNATHTKTMTESNHSKMGSNASMASNSSMRKADTPSSKIEKFSTTLPTAEVATAVITEVAALRKLPIASSVASRTLSPKEGENESPSLVKSSAPSPDAKHSSLPFMGSSSTIDSGKKKSVKPVVPAVAVPRAFETQPRPLHHHVLNFDLGTKTWPFVKNFKGK
ncbi:hypothetical protein VTL71DRAFT_15299 [Oculimacula yallundae]|uniref:RRM domain-containing protein n=1 Tax=Oculimacula yallundae TaxID=86028 RepID=A0ABR4CHH3_9HELO